MLNGRLPRICQVARKAGFDKAGVKLAWCSTDTEARGLSLVRSWCNLGWLLTKSHLFASLAAFALLLGCASEPPVVAPAPQPVEPAKVDRVLVLKGERELHLLAGDRTVRSYPVALGFAPNGPKRKAGDGRTPEGTYVLDRRNPNSSFYRSIHISYPGPADREHARRNGIDPGGDIMIHGLPNGREWVGAEHARFDWTEGCIAVTNAEMDEIWAMIDDGTPIEIRP